MSYRALYINSLKLMLVPLSFISGHLDMTINLRYS